MRHRKANRYAECGVAPLEEAFLVGLETASGMKLSPFTRGMIEGSVHMYGKALQHKKRHKQRERHQDAWNRVAKKAASLAASIGSSGAFADARWCDSTLAVPPDVLLQQLANISRSGPPTTWCQNPAETEDDAVPTAMTEQSVGFGHRILTTTLQFVGHFQDRWDEEKKRRPHGVQAAPLKLRRLSTAESDCLLRQMAHCYRNAGGEVGISWIDETKSIVGGPFARFLMAIWPVLPAGKPKTAQTFARRAKEILPQLRPSSGSQPDRIAGTHHILDAAVAEIFAGLDSNSAR
jgi:hypothetical protein